MLLLEMMLWIGQNATILPGVKIGYGVIIGTKSVVRSNAEPYTIATGKPVKIIQERFEDELIALMLKLKRRDLPE
jgi:acetyltransferase-like isoleucine patch superfamily enzyme